MIGILELSNFYFYQECYHVEGKSVEKFPSCAEEEMQG